MKTKVSRFTALFILLSVSFTMSAQEYKKDTRSLEEKIDHFNVYQAGELSNIDLLKALELAGIRVFKFNLSPFEKEYRLDLIIDEYTNGEKKEPRKYAFGNAYMHPNKDNPQEYYKDYIDNIMVYSEQKDNVSTVNISTLSMGMRVKLEPQITRDAQFYMWRRYGKADWNLNEEVPILVYASSWHDDKFNIERFCGIVDLSLDEKGTEELLTSSPHYFVVSYKVYEK